MVVAMEDIENIKNNLSNVVYLYENFRLDGDLENYISLEYVKDNNTPPVKILKEKLEDYFLKNGASIDITAVQHLGLSDVDALQWSFDAFQKISGIVINGKKRLISLRYDFLATVDDASTALELLENNNKNHFFERYKFLTEQDLFNETNFLMLIAHHVSNIVRIKSEEED